MAMKTEEEYLKLAKAVEIAAEVQRERLASERGEYAGKHRK